MDTDSTEHVNIRTLGSADTTTIGNLADTDVKSVHVDLQSFDGTGDGAADSVVVRGTDGDDRLSAGNDGNDQTIEGASVEVSVFGDEAADAIRVEGLDGADTFTSSVAVHGQIPVHFTGGDGQDTAPTTAATRPTRSASHATPPKQPSSQPAPQPPSSTRPSKA